MPVNFWPKLLFYIYLFGIAIDGATSRQPKCVPIETEICAGIGYNLTRFPNLAGNDNERTAVEEIRTYEPLISVRCSDELRFFLCASYFPLCNDKVPDAIGPCRPLCQRVKSKCLKVLKEVDYPWPPHLDCSKFPEENNEESMCMAGPNDNSMEQDSRPSSNLNQFVRGHWSESSVQQPDISGPYPICTSSEHVYMNRTALCIPKCSHTHGYQASDLHSTRSALLIGSILSFVLTGVCLVACFVKRLGRGRNVKRSPVDSTLFYSAFCFAFSAAVYVLSIFQRDKIACFSYQIHELFVVPGIPHIPCTLAATLLYYSGTAARLWWLSTCAAWRWSIRNGQNPGAKASTFLYNAHVFSWATPFVLLTIALMAQAAHAEQLSGVCLIGAVGRGNFQMFVLVRDLVVIVASVLILGSGCLTSAQTLNGFVANNGVGILCAILPIAQTFWFLASIFHLYGSSAEQIIGVGNMAKLLADPSLGALLGGSFFVYLLHLCWSEPTTAQKAGYQAGRPLYPSVQRPGGNLTSTTSVPITSSSQRSSGNLPSTQPNVYGVPVRPPPPPPITLHQIGNC